MASETRTPLETLLFVDDEPMMVDLFRDFMTMRGYRVLTASGGLVALNIVEAEGESIQLTVTDMTMPDMDGLELARRLAVIAPHIPVLIATGHDTGQAGVGLPLNVAGIIQKPYQNRAIAERIRQILDSR